MLDAHTSALAGPLLRIGRDHGGPPALAVALLAPFTSLCGCTTSYSTGSFLIFYGMDLVPMRLWFGAGAAVAVLHCVVWVGVGMAYWKALGLY